MDDLKLTYEVLCGLLRPEFSDYAPLLLDQVGGRQALAAELLNHLDRCASTTAAFHLVKSLCQIELGIEPNTLGVIVE